MCSPDPELTINLVVEDDDEDRLREREEELEEEEELLEDEYYNQYRTGAGLGTTSNPDLQGPSWSDPTNWSPPPSGFGTTTAMSPEGPRIRIKPRGRGRAGFNYRPRLTIQSGGGGGGK